MEPDEAHDPVEIRTLGMDRIVVEPQDHADVIQEFRGYRVDRGGVSHKKPLYGDGVIVDNRPKANIPEIPIITNDIKAKMPANVERAKMPENPCITGLLGQDDVLING